VSTNKKIKTSKKDKQRKRFISVRKKIIVSFLAVVVFMVGVNVFAFLKITDIQKNYETMVQRDIVALMDMQQFQRSVLEELNLVQKYGLTKDEHLLVSLQTLTENNKRDLQLLTATMAKEKYKGELKTLKTIMDNYLDVEGNMIKAVQADNMPLFNALMQRRLAEAVSLKMENIVKTIKLETLAQQKTNDQTTNNVKRLVFITMLLNVITTIGIAGLISRMIARPVKMLEKHVTNMANGDLTQDIPSIKNNDEIGNLVIAFQHLQKQFKDVIGKIQYHAEQVATTSVELAAGTEQTTTSIEQITVAMQEMASGAESQVNNIKETSNYVYEFKDGINQIAKNANDASNAVSNTSTSASKGFEVIEMAITQMNQIGSTVEDSVQVVTKLNERSGKISEIIELITNIADQTNLLALNAAIEAARAGEQGKGFAVVAEEVRKLAVQSGDAAHNISTMITEIREDTVKSVESMIKGNNEVKQGIVTVEKVGESFKEILGSIQQVTATSDHTLNSAQMMEQSVGNVIANITDIEKIIENSAGHTQTVAATSEEQNASMEEIRSSIDSLSSMAEELRDIVYRFKMKA